MADKPLFNLDADDRWRLAYDSNQWVLQRRVGSSGSNRSGIRESGWRGVFLRRRQEGDAGALISRKGHCPDRSAARARFDALPDNFLAFIAVPERFFARPEAEAA